MTIYKINHWINETLEPYYVKTEAIRNGYSITILQYEYDLMEEYWEFIKKFPFEFHDLIGGDGIGKITIEFEPNLSDVIGSPYFKFTITYIGD